MSGGVLNIARALELAAHDRHRQRAVRAAFGQHKLRIGPDRLKPFLQPRRGLHTVPYVRRIRPYSWHAQKLEVVFRVV